MYLLRLLQSCSARLILCLAGMTLAVTVGGANLDQDSMAARALQRGPVLILGDSLSAAFGIDIDAGWVALLRERLAARGYKFEIVNASISGDTTRGAVARLDAELARSAPKVVIIELGGNDGLRGLSLTETERNLTTIIQRSLAADASVLLLGIVLPPNLGRSFNERFGAIYGRLAANYAIQHVPFFMERVGGVDSMMQADGIHPNERGQRILLNNVWPVLAPMLGIEP